MAQYINIPPSGGGDWYATQKNLLSGYIPQLTQFETLKFGDARSGNVTLPANLVDGATEGGSLAINGVATHVKLQTATSYQNMLTGRFAWAARIKVAAIAAGEYSLFGFTNSSNKWIFVGTDQSVSATKFVVELSGAAANNPPTSLNADTSWHTVAATYDLTTLNVYIDGANVLSTASVANLPNGAVSIGGLSSTAAGIVRFNRAIYGYVDP